jgi:UDP-N-acetylmuramate dehydrogenase
MSNQDWADLTGMREHVELGLLTTYGRGGRARWFLSPKGPTALDGLKVPPSIPVLVLGRGSNLLVADTGFDGLVIHVGQHLSDMRFDPTEVHAEGGAALPVLARAAAARSAGGLGFFVGIPGSVGGAVAMNAGCFGSEVADVLIDARIHNLRTGKSEVRTANFFEFGYRRAKLSNDELVMSARFSVSPAPEAALKQELREVTRWRRDHQPGGTRNAGSVFKNPDGDSAGRIIDSLGLKGLSVGSASVSEKHANFFVLSQDGAAQDVFDLITQVASRVLEATGIQLVPEVRLVGFE